MTGAPAREIGCERSRSCELRGHPVTTTKFSRTHRPSNTAHKHTTSHTRSVSSASDRGGFAAAVRSSDFRAHAPRAHPSSRRAHALAFAPCHGSRSRRAPPFTRRAHAPPFTPCARAPIHRAHSPPFTPCSHAPFAPCSRAPVRAVLRSTPPAAHRHPLCCLQPGRRSDDSPASARLP